MNGPQLRCSHPHEVHQDRSTPCCFILPPDLLARLAEEGSPEQREAALRTIGSSASLRARRSLVTSLLRDPQAQASALALIAPTRGERRTVYDAHHNGQSQLPGTKARGEGDPPSTDEAVNEAYDGADLVYDFYEQIFDRDSIDGQGMEIISSVHFGVGYDNAFWNGSQMVYGDGSGSIFVQGGLTRAIDVIGHELTHGVTEFTAGLEYHTQPGALNESFSDVFGSLIKQRKLEQTAEQASAPLDEGPRDGLLG
jgi:Zn-dependent metalloprotease